MITLEPSENSPLFHTRHNKLSLLSVSHPLDIPAACSSALSLLFIMHLPVAGLRNRISFPSLLLPSVCLLLEPPTRNHPDSEHFSSRFPDSPPPPFGVILVKHQACILMETEEYS